MHAYIHTTEQVILALDRTCEASEEWISAMHVGNACGLFTLNPKSYSI